MGHWLDFYAADWIRAAIIEALYQGRYKAISVEHILTLWQKRGHPAPHFTGDFERIICRKLPEWYMTLANPELADAENELPAVPLTTVAEGMRTHSPLQMRIQGIERWRYLAQVGELGEMHEKAIARLQCFVGLDLADIWPGELLTVTTVATPVIGVIPEMETLPTPDSHELPPLLTAETEAATPITPAPADPTPPPEDDHHSIAIEVSPPPRPRLELPNPQTPVFRSGIRTFIPAVVVSAFFLRLQRFQAQSILVVMDREGDQWFTVEVEPLTLPVESL